jgi:hypothetical protein
VYSIIRALAASDLTSFDRCQCARTDERWMQVIGLRRSDEVAAVFMLQDVRSQAFPQPRSGGSNSTFP